MAIVDTGAALVLTTGIATKHRPITAIGFAAVLTGGPLVHFVEEHPVRAAISVGTHLFTPLLGFVVADKLAPSDRNYTIGLFAGYALAIGIDLLMAKPEDTNSKRVLAIGGAF